MVARTPPPKVKKMVAPLNPILLRETINKVDKCMARLQELQYTATGGTKVISGVSFSPRSSRGYLRTSLRCKQESARPRNYTPRKSPTGKLPTKNTGEWRRMSLPAMLLGETVGEILQASQFAKETVAAIAPNSNTTANNDPKTPITIRRNQKQNPENSELRAPRKREKQPTLQSIRQESDAPRLHRAKSLINFKISPPRKTESEKENCRYMADRVSPRNKLWAKKSVIFPNPLFHPSPTSNHQKLGNTTSPVIARNRQTPHKFLVKSPASASKFQVKIKSPPLRLPPTRPSSFSKKSPKVSTAVQLRRSFSPSRLASRSVSPLKSRKSSVQKSDGMRIKISGLKQRPQNSTPMKFLARRI